jgi:small subunit ribosomal protein S24e
MPEDKKEKEVFILYARKMINNPLLKRKQLVVELIHPDQGSVSKAAIKNKLEAMFKVKPEAISVFGLHSKFGGGRSSGFACIYDDVDARKKCDTKSMLLRDKLRELPPKKAGRKMLKEMKGRMKKVRGIAKTKAANSSGKKR